MRIYEIALVVTLISILIATLRARARLKATCPHCGQHEGQRTLSQRVTLSRNVLAEDRSPFEPGRREKRFKALRQTFFTGGVTCTKCGQVYERKWFDESDLL